MNDQKKVRRSTEHPFMHGLLNAIGTMILVVVIAVVIAWFVSTQGN